MEVKKYYTHDGSCIYGEEGPFSICVVFYSDYAALEARYARIVEWMRGKGCEFCGHRGHGKAEFEKNCRNCAGEKLNRGVSECLDNWTLPARLGVKP